MRKRLLVLLFVIIAATGATWAAFHFGALKWHNPLAYSANRRSTNTLSWEEAVEKIKADRGAGAYAAVEIPTELRHYEDRHWFLAAQVAEVEHPPAVVRGQDAAVDAEVRDVVDAG